MMSQVHRPAAAGSRSFGRVQPRTCLRNLKVILSFRVSRGRELRRPVVDSVAGGTLAPWFRVFYGAGGVPARSSSRRAWMAFARVSSCRRAAASESGSGRTGGCLLPLAAVGFEGGDDLVQVVGDLPVHLGDAGMGVGWPAGMTVAARRRR